jgi:hypothetical protein
MVGVKAEHVFPFQLFDALLLDRWWGKFRAGAGLL